MNNRVTILIVVFGLIGASLLAIGDVVAQTPAQPGVAESSDERFSALERGIEAQGVRLKRVEQQMNLRNRRLDEISDLTNQNRQELEKLEGAAKSAPGVGGNSPDPQMQQSNNDMTGRSLGVRNERRIERIHRETELNKGDLNRYWILLSALLLFVMQAGFKVYEVGLVRMQDHASVGIKNLLDWMVVCLSFYLIGFGLMFGESFSGLIGVSWFAAEGIDSGSQAIGFEFLLLQIALAATVATIVSGALAVRCKLFSYLLVALFIGTCVYPLIGHWVWGNRFISGNQPWLAEMGFIDFAGSTVVHSVAAWVALVGMYILRPRAGKYIVMGQHRIEIGDREKFRPFNLGYSFLGVFILWFGWWGFSGSASVLALGQGTGGVTDPQLPSVILNFALAGATSGLIAFLHSYFFQKRRYLLQKLMGGSLGGLVAITGAANLVSPIVTVTVIAPVAAIIHNWAYDRLDERPLFNRIIDDPVGAIVIHGCCGVWGTLCVALGETDKIKYALGPFYHSTWSRLEQVGDQLFGIVVCFFVTVALSALVFGFLQSFIGLEVSFQEEAQGDIVGLSDHGQEIDTGTAGIPTQPPS